MVNQYLLTIAIPTYNGARTIKNVLDLLIPQITDEVELIISNNNSIDETRNIIEEYKERYDFINIINNDMNIGPDANFLQCMELANGKFTWLVSDDDVVIEGAVHKVLEFLKKHQTVGLLYVETVNFRGTYTGIKACEFTGKVIDENIKTTDKIVFIDYCRKYWGFMSSFICNTDKFKTIKNANIYFGTFWLQSYIHALCSVGNTELGVVKGPILGAGVYVNTTNFDSPTVNGIFYKKMIDFMVLECGYDKQQLNKMYIDRLCLLSRHDILKEKASGKLKMNKKILFTACKGYIKPWLTVYPFLMVPNFLCKIVLEKYKKMNGMNIAVQNNRPE